MSPIDPDLLTRLDRLEDNLRGEIKAMGSDLKTTVDGHEQRLDKHERALYALMVCVAVVAGMSDQTAQVMAKLAGVIG
jgi:hypothetical protein